VEVSVELGGCEFVKVMRHEREADEIALRAMAEDILLDFTRQIHKPQDWFRTALLFGGGGHGCADRAKGGIFGGVGLGVAR
jgi:hypothetical protein